MWRGLRTPEGAATLAVQQRSDRSVHAAAWGAGASWVLDALPAMLGADDDIAGFDPLHPALAARWRRDCHWRFGRSGLVMQALIASIIEQRVTGQEAFAGYRALVRRYGDTAPGPGASLGLMVPPDTLTVRMVPSWEWLRLGIDPQRSRAIIRACQVAPALERAAARGPGALDAALQSIPGIGVWTSAEVRRVALGDPDAVSFGDYHVAKNVGWAMTGEPFDDAALETFLEPWRAQRQRQRAVELIARTFGMRPRRGARLAPRTHLPTPR